MQEKNNLAYERYSINKTNAKVRTITIARDGEVKISQSSNVFGIGKKANRIYVTKFSYYVDKELSEFQLKKLSAWLEMVKDNRYEGKKFPRFKGLLHTDETRKYKVTKTTKDTKDYDNLAKRLDGIVKNNFFGAWDEFLVTLTNGRKGSVKTMDKDITAFGNRLRRALDGKDYKLVMVKEYNEHGYHLHVLFKCKTYQSLNSVDELFSKAWKVGFIRVNRLKNPQKISSYFFGSSVTRTWENVKVDDNFIQGTKDDYALSRMEKKLYPNDAVYQQGYKDAKEDYKRTKRSEVKAEDKLMYVSGTIEKPLRFKTDDFGLFELLLSYFEYSYKVDVIDDCDQLLNRTIVDVCRIPREELKQVYDYVYQVVLGGRANG
ncbi:rolling circle replication-associated protein [Ligilactobacillus equi]